MGCLKLGSQAARICTMSIAGVCLRFFLAILDMDGHRGDHVLPHLTALGWQKGQAIPLFLGGNGKERTVSRPNEQCGDAKSIVCPR